MAIATTMRPLVSLALPENGMLRLATQLFLAIAGTLVLTLSAKTKVMPDEFIAKSGNGVTDAFHRYLAPLLGSDMPVAGRLAGEKVAKILKA